MQSLLGKTFLIANMFKNIDICIRGGNQTRQYIDVLPPTSEDDLIRLECEDESEVLVRIQLLSYYILQLLLLLQLFVIKVRIIKVIHL